MKCPHCQVAFHDKWAGTNLGNDRDGKWIAKYTVCPTCEQLIVRLTRWMVDSAGTPYHQNVDAQVYPRGANRPAAAADVPKKFAGDYNEACAVIGDSPKASAALSRRCFQNVLREKAGVKQGDLASEIQQVLDSKQLSSSLAESIDAVRNIGNFAAHPIKSQHSGEILEVEPGEAEWNLDVLEALFDFYFVQPEILKKKKAALDAKLKDAGKPAMKAP
jgi:hypothetical protein